jgi:hypothetical protein
MHQLSQGILPLVTTSGGAVRLPSTYYDNATTALKSVEIIQDNALMVSVFVPLELTPCGTSSCAEKLSN